VNVKETTEAALSSPDCLLVLRPLRLSVSALNYTPKLTITAQKNGEADSPSERQRDTDAAPSSLDCLLLLHPLRLSVSALNYTPN